MKYLERSYMRLTIKFLKILLNLTLFFHLVGCGVKSSPTHPKGSAYPQIYPNVDIGLKKNPKTRSLEEKIKNNTKGNIFDQYPNRNFRN